MPKALKVFSIMDTKICYKCKKELPLDNYFKFENEIVLPCKKCKSEYGKLYFRTKKGLSHKIYAQQKRKSKMRNWEMPNYTREELLEWMLKQHSLDSLFNKWMKSNYDRMLTPSCDRLDDYKPYTFDNIRLVTWKENEDKGHNDRINGINNKASKAVIQYDFNYNLIKEYFSISEAHRQTGFLISGISRCCSGERPTAYGYLWEFK